MIMILQRMNRLLHRSIVSKRLTQHIKDRRHGLMYSPWMKYSTEPQKSISTSAIDTEALRRFYHHQKSNAWYYLGGFALISVGIVAFGPELKLGMSKNTAEVATKALQDETLQSHTRELASQIVQTVLNDPNVLQQASNFLQRLMATETTRNAVINLVKEVLNDDITRMQVQKIAQHVVANLLQDKVTRDHMVTLVQALLADQNTYKSVMSLVDNVLKSRNTRENVNSIVIETMYTPKVQEVLSNAIASAVHDVLSREDIANHAKLFVGEVVKDHTVQTTSGEAIWGSVMYAITPSWLSWTLHNKEKYDNSMIEDEKLHLSEDYHTKDTMNANVEIEKKF